MKAYIIILTLIFQGIALTGYAQRDTLRQHIFNLIKTKQAAIGVGVYDLETGDTMTLGGHNHYPMQSIYKFHLALAVLNEVDKGNFSLDMKIRLTKKNLKIETRSPLRDKYPNGEVDISLREILNYTVSQSDNNGCDILFNLMGGTKVVDKYIHKLGLKDVSIKETEEDMVNNGYAQLNNWTTPYAAIDLLYMFYQKQIISVASYDFLWAAMVNATTGPDRIKGLLPKGTVVAHKTGTSSKNADGIRAAVNDMGIITLPNGRHIALAVFLSNSYETDETNAKIIAEISKLVYNFYGSAKN